MKGIMTKMLVALTVMMLTVGIADAQQKHDYVDLGLPSGTLWATCNVGANNPWEYGDYFAWGETATKSKYGWSTYKYCKNGDPDELIKYRNDRGCEIVIDTLTLLQRIDDAATVRWGGNWCMPTEDQLEELDSKCTWIWTTRNGTKGYEVKGPNGMSIFLPAAGCRIDASLKLAGTNGYYWSSSLMWQYPDSGFDLVFDSGNVSTFNDERRFIGCTIRPVRR